MQIYINETLFDGYQANYECPITRRTITLSISADESQHQAAKERITRNVIVLVVFDLKKRQQANFDYLLKFKELSTKQKGLIRAIQENLAKLNESDQHRSIAQFNAFIYENIYPYLGMFKPSTPIYDRLLQFIENQCNTSFEGIEEKVQIPVNVNS